MIKILIGNLFESKAHTLVNTVNCVGVMGKGVALEFKKRYPELFDDYARRCADKQVKPGDPYLYDDLFGTSILNFPTKDHWRSPSKVEDVIRGLDIFTEKYREWGIESIAFPPLGCGNGGLEWSVIGPIMYQKLSPLDIDIEIYAPFGTPRQQLTTEFLSQSASLEKAQAHKRAQHKLTAEWVALLEVLYRLERQPYANPVGRTIFQKICYTMTEQGIKTGFQFRQNSYGPFSDEVKTALSTFANANLIYEIQLGQMTALKIGPEYPAIREKFADEFRDFLPKINKTVDLFSRIKSTQQAEEVTTVFYAVRELKKLNPNGKVSEQEVYDYVLKWKRHWNNADKHDAIASSIRNLAILNWVKVTFSGSLPIEDAL
ncbi:type II toxin-antitoxin system antitoxin DNA ADP-ribosyl glycohydrolase DarG [Desulfuromonas acetexigens]|jgi:O-acetyl-ADP-ribose deacetylase (regulator of RNase III)|uniref:Macro domain-containing protein n=1 Tax=Trichloromonas acetexigens TaxID=38815 RepID=A0A550JBM7_9BACT|nr:macro domain-containing protein [Desulfuromonas acetexigens]TRO80543.1 macro domain-containing protein [Desulfuromonas acetexigens]